MAKKTSCPITRAEFRAQAKPLEVVINGMSIPADVKEFSTGSIGWNINSKMSIKVGDKSLSVQVGLNITVIGSKELPQDGEGGASSGAESQAKMSSPVDPKKGCVGPK